MGLSGRLILFITTEIPYFVLILCNVENKVICVLLNATNRLKIILGSAFHVRSKLIVYWLKRIVLEPFWCWCGWWFLSFIGSMKGSLNYDAIGCMHNKTSNRLITINKSNHYCRLNDVWYKTSLDIVYLFLF